MRFLVPATGLMCLALIGCLKEEPAPDTDTASTDVDAADGDTGLEDADTTPDSGESVDFCAIERFELSNGPRPTPAAYIPIQGDPCECRAHRFYFNPTDPRCWQGMAQCAGGGDDSAWLVTYQCDRPEPSDDTGTEQ